VEFGIPMDIPFLNDVEIIFGLSVVVLLVCHKLRVPTVVGFLVTGVVVGPHALGLVKAVRQVEMIAEVGVVLLLFTIGLEFSLERLLRIKRAVLGGGSLQVAVTSAVTAIVAMQFGLTAGQAIFAGFLVALSSTAIVLRLLQQRAQIDSPHGIMSLGILIFQDIIIVPMILLVPILAGTSGNLTTSLLVLLAKGGVIIVLVIVSARWIVPQLLYLIARTRNTEVFLLSVIVICLGIAWLTAEAGLSLALGAFLAGLIISESEYSHQALGNLLPFRDVFTTFFFVSIGMLLDLGFLIEQPGRVLLITLAVLVAKALIAGGVTVVLGFPFRTGILAGLALGQIGEFSFILSRSGVEYGLMNEAAYQLFLAVSVLSMAATPFIIMAAPRLADRVLRLPLPGRLVTGFAPLGHTDAPVQQKDHLVIIGFGINGRNLAKAARTAGIPYIIIETNPETVRTAKADGEPIFYGDATHRAVLEHAGIHQARIAVVAINDPTATRRITDAIRRLNTGICLIVRSRYIQEMKHLYELGADEVIPEEFETSVEIFTRVLTKYLVPREDIERLVAAVRADGYEMFRQISKTSISVSDLRLNLHDVKIQSFRLKADSPLVGMTIGRADLRRCFAVSIVAISRNGQILANPGADTVVKENDVLFVLGNPDNIAQLKGMMVYACPLGDRPKPGATS